MVSTRFSVVVRLFSFLVFFFIELKAPLGNRMTFLSGLNCLCNRSACPFVRLAIGLGAIALFERVRQTLIFLLTTTWEIRLKNELTKDMSRRQSQMPRI